MVVGLALQYLRSHVHWRAAHGLREVVVLLHLLCESQVSNDYIDVTDELCFLFVLLPFITTSNNHLLIYLPKVNENVGKFDISMQDIHVVKCLESVYDLRKEETSFLLIEVATRLP